jgi:RNA polymerase sigma-B factor
MKAIHRFDAERGELRSFAAVTISGELKRHLRDRGWSVHVPRGLQERAMAVNRATEELTQATGRVPTIPDLAAALELSPEEIAEAISVVHGYRAISLDHAGDENNSPLDMLGANDPALGDAASRTAIDEALAALPERERLIVYLRFYEDMTQSQIAEQIGISQMHVSRLLSRSLDDLGDLLSIEEWPP